MNLSIIDNLKQHFSGKIITPEDSDYSILSSTPFSVGGAPILILQPNTAEDVREAVLYAKNNKVTLSIRSGGHSNAGFATNIGGVVIDMSRINTVEIIDKDKHIVRIGSGARWGDVANTLKQYNLAISAGDTKSVGVGGLTLGGGIGWMVRKYGLALDTVIAAELVLANGDVIRVSPNDNADLFWAIRGGGGNFGVVTYFEFQAHTIGNVYSGMMMFTLDNLPSLLKGWRDYMRTADEDLTTILNVMPSFGGNPPGVMLMVCYAGDNQQAADAAINPLKQLGTITMLNITLKAYADVLEEAHPPQGMTIIVKNVFIESFSDEVIDTMLLAQKAKPDIMFQIRGLGGAMKKVPQDATAFSYRNSEVMVLSPTFLPLNASQDVITQALKPWLTVAALGKGAYANFLSTSTPEDVALIYSKETYERLQRIKKMYDPTNMFSQNYNILPQ